MDVNQPSRVRSYSELKLLLAFNSTIDPKLRAELERRLETVSLNPLSNNTDSEIELARKQYDALVEFANRENGLPAKIERDRRAEMTPLVHGRATRFLFGLGNVLTFGRYVHREKATPELAEQMEVARRVEYHTRLLQQVAKSSPQVEIVWTLDDVRTSLRFLSDRANTVHGSAAKAAAQLFQRTSDNETRQLCLDLLSRVNDKTARNEMLRMFRQQQPQSEWRVALADRLRKAVTEDTRIKAADARLVLAEIGQP
jgi:PAS domain-containing protein